jgi:serine/threonine protein kinase
MAMEPIPFGKYLLVDKVAQGGMAEVYRALLRGPGGFEKTVALKRILPAFAEHDDFLSRFMDEAKLVAGLTHMNIAQVFDFGEVDGSHYLAMEFVEGVDLGRLQDAARRMGNPLSVASAVFIVAEAARGLAYAHAHAEKGTPLGIVHRDVSPQNILCSYAGEVKIADFGIAKATAAMHKMAHQSESGAMMGKLRYMSPEQVAGEPLDGRSDIFALGVVLWEALTARPLIDADNPAAAVEMVKKAVFAAPSTRASGVPPDLDRIVGKALARDRGARYERAADLARDLTLFLNERSPGFSREDLGAFIERVAPRKRDLDERVDDGDEVASPHAATAPGKPGARNTPGKALVKPQPKAIVAPPPSALAETRLTPQTQASWKRRTTVVAIGMLCLGGAGGVALRWRPHPVVVIDNSQKSDGGNVAPPDALMAIQVAVPDGGVAIDKNPPGPDHTALRQALLATPREEVTRRGVASSPEYRAVISAVDAALCATPTGRADPVFPADVDEPLRRLSLVPEATALARYLLATGELPPEQAAALDALTWKGPSFAPGESGYSAAALQSLHHRADPRFAVELVRQQGTLGRWRDASAAGAPAERYPELCERAPAVNRLMRLVPDGRLGKRLDRYLKAIPQSSSAEEGGVRYAVSGSERDREAQTLSIVVKATNPSAETIDLLLTAARLDGMDRAPALEPDLPTLPPNSVREVRLTFAAVDDELADGALLLIGKSELQGYSELLR